MSDETSPRPRRRRLRDATPEELRAEAALFAPARERAMRLAAPLLAQCWAEQDEDDDPEIVDR